MTHLTFIACGMEDSNSARLKAKLKRVVAMLTRLALRADSVSESAASYGLDYDYEHEHRCAEHEKW